MSSWSAGARVTLSLRGALQRELAMLDTARKTAGHLGYCVLAIGRDEVGKGCEQRGVGEHLRLDAVTQRLFPSIEDVSERRLRPSVVVQILDSVLGSPQR